MMSTNSEFDTTPAHEEHSARAGEPTTVRDRPRPGTIVWGLIIVVLAALLIVAEFASFSIDMGQVLIALLIGAGIALLVGGIWAATSGSKR